VPAGVWAYDGEGWHELANVCGASDGRIAWAGPNEFWTVSDGRPGQASESRGFAPPLEDNTLCRFALNPGTGNLEVVDSYASLAFQSTSYQAMHAASCLSASDCWFAGDSLPEPQIGSFQLHWNGRTLTAEPYLPEGHAVEDLRTFEGGLFESLRLSASDRFIKRSLEVPAMHALDGEGTTSFEPVTGLPLYGPGEFPYALDFLHLSSDEDALWAAAGTVIEPPEKSAEAGVTVLRYSKVQYSKESHEYLEEGSPSWVQVLGPQSEPSGLEAFSEDQIVNAVAGEPGHAQRLARPRVPGRSITRSQSARAGDRRPHLRRRIDLGQVATAPRRRTGWPEGSGGKDRVPGGPRLLDGEHARVAVSSQHR
jgi:hypothetical protein